jgi:hypothetical protein
LSEANATTLPPAALTFPQGRVRRGAFWCVDFNRQGHCRPDEDAFRALLGDHESLPSSIPNLRRKRAGTITVPRLPTLLVSLIGLLTASRTRPPSWRAQFLLANATDAEDYRAAATEVKKLGLPKNPHHKPRTART